MSFNAAVEKAYSDYADLNFFLIDMLPQQSLQMNSFTTLVARFELFMHALQSNLPQYVHLSSFGVC
jgi:hypothetical protein